MMGREVCEALTLAEADSDVVAIVLTGAGRAFCAGADLKLLQSISSERRSSGDRSESAAIPGDPEIEAGFRKTYSYLASLRKPLLGAINGPCVGLGFAVALFCDIRIASESAFFMSAFARRGLVAEHGLAWMLPRLTGVANAMDILLSSRRVSATEALQMGLINRVVTGAELTASVSAYAQDLVLNCAPESMRIMKRQVYDNLNMPLSAAYDDADQLMRESFERPDMKEGVDSFLEKRAPKFARIKLPDSASR